MPDRVFVTGGSGALGGAIVRRFCAGNHKVAFTYRNSEEAAKNLEKETGSAALPADLTRRDEVQAAVQRAEEMLGGIDVLVNNAGSTQVMPFALIEEEDWDAVIAANLKSLFLTTHAVCRGMIARKRGVIINVGSLAGHRMLEVPIHYATAKAGVSGFTIALAGELSRYGIRVNSVVPGLLEDGIGRMVPAKQAAEYVRYCAAGRAGNVREAADVVVFLASEGAGYINAQNIFVDGGI
jgi:NAD(P)-dependent dehydrogenase (short-subunit alcohol dehydrogenase family)